ncbi:MAG: HPF/RaiA family ribosome-associated protein [Bdellovibrionales bacterium]
MHNDCVQFEFVGFDPEYEVKSFISTVAERLHLRSPSDSAIKMAMKLSKGAVQASCRVVSHAGIFAAEAISDNPIKAIKKVEKKIADQLDRWKSRRFLNDESQITVEEYV